MLTLSQDQMDALDAGALDAALRLHWLTVFPARWLALSETERKQLVCSAIEAAGALELSSRDEVLRLADLRFAAHAPAPVPEGQR